MGITVLWVMLWLQAGVAPAPWNRLIALMLFGVACCDTVLFGMVLPSRQPAAPREPGLWSSSAIGVLTLAAVSWTPLLAIGTIASLGSGSIGPFAVILIFGMPVSLALAVVGYFIILLLLGIGRVLAWANRHHRRSGGAARRLA